MVEGFEEVKGRSVHREILAGWEARTRPLAGPLSPRGPQPVGVQDGGAQQIAQWADGPKRGGTEGVVRVL